MGHRKWTVALVAVAVGLLVGCQRQGTAPSVEDYAKRRQEAAEARQRQAPERSAPEEPAADEGESGFGGSDYVYDPIGKRDPFRSFVLERAAEEESEEQAPLEQFDLSQLELTGVIWRSERRRALVKDPSGRSYIVGEGDPMGKNEGRIVRIGESSVHVREAYVDFHGEKTTKEIVMRVRQSEGG